MKHLRLLILLVSVLSIGTAQAAMQESLRLPHCGGTFQASPNGFKIRVTLDRIPNCSNVTIGSRTMKMNRTNGLYSLAFDLPLLNAPGEILVHSNSRQTLDRIPSEGQPAPEPIPYPEHHREVSGLMDICQDAFDGPTHESECIRIARDRGLRPELIRACEEAFDGDANEMECLRLADRLDVVRACEEAFDGDANEMECLRLADHPDVIRACEEAFDGDPNELACLRATAEGGAGTAALIRQCEEQRDGDAAELECIQSLFGPTHSHHHHASSEYPSKPPQNDPSCIQSCSVITTNAPSVCTRAGCGWTGSAGHYTCTGTYNRCLLK